MKVNLRKEAKGRECQNRMAGLNGAGIKPDDIFGAWACSSCHDECDRRTRKLEHDYVRQAHAEGVFRTQAILRKEGKL